MCFCIAKIALLAEFKCLLFVSLIYRTYKISSGFNLLWLLLCINVLLILQVFGMVSTDPIKFSGKFSACG